MIGQAYDLKEVRTSLVLEKKKSADLSYAAHELRLEVKNKEEEINLRLLQNKVCQDDNKYMRELIHKGNRKIRLLKTGLYVVGGIAILELGYIGYQAIKR